MDDVYRTNQKLAALVKEQEKAIGSLEEEIVNRSAETKALRLETKALKRTIRDLRNRGRCDKLPSEPSYSESGE